jgi:alkylation response protein AidB-like acyl-CoA dehydrogenase
VIERDRSGTVPVRELAALDASGLLAVTVPRKHDGAEVPAIVLAEVIRTIAAVDPAVAQIPQGHFLLVDVLAVFGTPEQRRRLFADVLAGGRLGNGLAERGGQHAQDLQTRLVRRGSLPRLTGRKYYCTGAITARWLGVTALDEDEVTRTPRNAAAAARGSLAIAQAKAFGSEVAAEVASDMFALSGASAADERYDLSRHWRNARTHASHDPVAWKYHHIGNYLLNDALPPNHGQI